MHPLLTATLVSIKTFFSGSINFFLRSFTGLLKTPLLWSISTIHPNCSHSIKWETSILTVAGIKGRTRDFSLGHSLSNWYIFVSLWIWHIRVYSIVYSIVRSTYSHFLFSTVKKEMFWFLVPNHLVKSDLRLSHPVERTQKPYEAGLCRWGFLPTYSTKASLFEKARCHTPSQQLLLLRGSDLPPIPYLCRLDLKGKSHTSTYLWVLFRRIHYETVASV